MLFFLNLTECQKSQKNDKEHGYQSRIIIKNIALESFQLWIN